MIIEHIKQVAKEVVSEFGFCSFDSLMTSLFKFSDYKVLSGFAVIGTATGAFLEHALGLKSYTLVILSWLVGSELCIGLLASLRRKEKIKIKRLQRFGLKVFIYSLLILVLNTLVMQYENRPEAYIYTTLHSFVVLYVSGVYLISVLGNTSFLLGGNKEIDGLLRVFKGKLKESTDLMEGGSGKKL